MSITGLGQWSDWWMYSGFSGKVGGGDKKFAKTSQFKFIKWHKKYPIYPTLVPKSRTPCTSLRLTFKPDRVNTIYLTRSFPTLGPSNWRINKDWILCSEGKLQSPINISAESLLFDPGLKSIIVTGNKVADETDSSVFFIKMLFFLSNQSTATRGKYIIYI